MAEPDALVWVQDYQLQLVPQMLRSLRPDVRIGFFLHIPFPPTELYQQLPWRNQLIEGLLGADLVGFQLPGGAQNFLRLVRQRLHYETRRDRIQTPDGRTVIARAYPISIDAAEGTKLTLGIRPEAVKTVPAAGDCALPCRFRRRENLGSESILHFEWLGEPPLPLLAKVNHGEGAEPAAEGTTTLGVAPSSIHVFDPDGRRIAGARSGASP